MKKVEITKVWAKNFMPIGDPGIEIDFQNYGNICIIKGKNLDVISPNGDHSSNGSGKSTIPEIVVYGLYGQTIKSLNFDKIINNKCGDGVCEVGVVFGNYKAIRCKGRNAKASLRLYELKNNIWEDITLGAGISATQQKIEELLGLNYDAFINLVVFRDTNAGCFLESKAATKRSIIEDTINISLYRQYNEKAKEYRKELNRDLKIKQNEYEILLKEITNVENRLNQNKVLNENWINNKKKHIIDLENKIVNKEEQILKSNFQLLLDNYNKLILEKQNLEQKLQTYEDYLEKSKTLISQYNSNILLIKNEINDISIKIKNLENEILSLQKENFKNLTIVQNASVNEDGATCDKCHGIIKKENISKVIESCNLIINDNNSNINNLKQSLCELKSSQEIKNSLLNEESLKIKNAEKNIEKLKIEVLSIKNKLAIYCNLNKPESGEAEKILQKEISDLQIQISEKKQELQVSPYLAILIATEGELEDRKKDCLSKKENLKKLAEDIKYCEFWCDGFGDNGIRRFLIREIIPSLNDKIAFWMGILNGGTIRCTFDDSFEELIERNPPDGESYVYEALSGGEKRRLNLTISLGLSHLRSLSCGHNPSLIFLDEVSTNVDSLGVEGIFNIINELSKEKQVFVTTHDQELLEKLSGNKELRVVKKNGISILES